MDKTNELVDMVVAALRGHVERALAPVIQRLGACEQRPALSEDDIRKLIGAIPPGPKGDPGEPGASGPAGERGEAGKSVTLDDVAPLIERAVADAVAKAIAALPPPQKGEPGEKGADGESVHPDTVRVMVQEAVDKAVAEIPPAEPGKDADPAAMAAAVHAEVERQFHAILPLIKGERGEPGAGLEDMEMELKEDGRTLVFRFVGAESTKEFEVVAPWQIYRGVYKPKSHYKQGDVVTFAGSSHVAKRDTDKPPETDDWQMCVKRGKDA